MFVEWWLKMIQWIACYFRNNYQLVEEKEKYFKLLNNFSPLSEQLIRWQLRLTRQILVTQNKTKNRATEDSNNNHNNKITVSK